MLRALDGRYILPEAGGDLLRDGAGVLPTGGPLPLEHITWLLFCVCCATAYLACALPHGVVRCVECAGTPTLHMLKRRCPALDFIFLVR